MNGRMHFTEIGWEGVDWTDGFQDWAVVNTIMIY